ncbi:hypothetical protein ACFU9O_02475 [Streptomyces albidoflavus]
MTTIATPPAAALDALLDRLSAGKSLTADEAALLRAGVTGLRRTAGGLQRRSQQQAARIAELEADGQAVLKREAIAQLAAAARAEYVAEQGATSSPAEEIAYHAFGLGARLDAAETTLARVRLYAELLALADMSPDAREVARIVLDVLDGKEPAEAGGPLPVPAGRVARRCFSCDHEELLHDVDGRCWFSVEQAVLNHNTVCPCQRRPADEDGVCTFGEGAAPGSGCIRSAGHTGAHYVTPGDVDDEEWDL